MGSRKSVGSRLFLVSYFFYVGPPKEDIFPWTPSKSCISVIAHYKSQISCRASEGSFHVLFLPVLVTCGHSIRLLSPWCCAILIPTCQTSISICPHLAGQHPEVLCFCGVPPWKMWVFRLDML